MPTHHGPSRILENEVRVSVNGHFLGGYLQGVLQERDRAVAIAVPSTEEGGVAPLYLGPECKQKPGRHFITLHYNPQDPPVVLQVFSKDQEGFPAPSFSRGSDLFFCPRIRRSS